MSRHGVQLIGTIGTIQYNNKVCKPMQIVYVLFFNGFSLVMDANQ